jgi:AIPR protein
MRVGFVPLMELYGIFRALGQKFFDRNIRAALSPDNAPNKKIREALDRIVLKEAEEPSIFVFRHNGVTLAAERVRIADGEMTLHVPRLLNGAQTVSSVARFLEERADNPLLQKNRSRLEEINVLAKIVEDDDLSGEFVTQITISNNQQNPVLPWALRAMDNRQVDLADKFRNELGIFYSRQEGAFENLSDDEREELGIEDSKDSEYVPSLKPFWRYRATSIIWRISPPCSSHRSYIKTRSNLRTSTRMRAVSWWPTKLA